MMMTDDTLQRIKDVPISDIISYFHNNLKKNGANWKMPCCFHNEDTPSFMASDAKNLYKCFGCGVSGDGINFVMQHERQSFIEACETIGKISGIPIEYKELSAAEKEAREKIISEIEKQEKVLSIVVPLYQKELHRLPDDHPAKLWLKERNMDDDTISKWQLGWGGDEWNTAASILINNELWSTAEKMNIAKHSKDNISNYDVYRSRIIFPLKDRSGKTVGIAGRWINNKFDNPNAPKFINPTNYELYNKSRFLFGLNEASANIADKNTAYVTEGYMDVISAQRYGLRNVVCPAGTSFTPEQMRILKKYCRHIIIWFDNDENKSGLKATKKIIPELLKLDFKVSVASSGSVKDADDWVNQLMTRKGITCHGAKPVETDAVVFFANNLLDLAGEDNYEKSLAKKTILRAIAGIPNDIIRNSYLDQLCSSHKWNRNDTKKEFAKIVESVIPEDASDEDEGYEKKRKYDKWMSDEDKETAEETGFLSVNRNIAGKKTVGYYSWGSNGKTEITNFLVQPLYKVEAGSESRYISEFKNTYESVVIDIPGKIFASPAQIQAISVAYGNYMIFGNDLQWKRIASKLIRSYEKCIELEALGWNQAGFFAFFDKVYIPGRGLVEYDKWGMFQHKGFLFYLPPASDQFQELIRLGNREYDDLKVLSYKQAPVTFSQWAQQMMVVWGKKGTIAIAFAILNCFRDLVFMLTKSNPFIYCYGEPSSGKSKFADSISKLFFYKKNAFNLNTGTDFAFSDSIAQFSNCPAQYNELDASSVKMDRINQIKGWFDGEGRPRGKMNGKRKSTEVQYPVSNAMLVGQKLITSDDNSLPTRSVIEAFGTKEYTAEEEHHYNLLKEWEDTGLSSLVCQILDMREIFEKELRELYYSILKNWRRNKATRIQLNSRILETHAVMSACYRLASRKLPLPEDADVFDEECYKKALELSSFIRETDTLSDFWRMLEFLNDENIIEYGWDFVVDDCVDLTVAVDRNDTRKIDFSETTKVLFLRINTVHKHFQKEYRLREGKEAMSLENMLHYFKQRRYYLGSVRKKRFVRFRTINEEVSRHDPHTGKSVSFVQPERRKEETITSCFAFVYEDLGIDVLSNLNDDEKEGLPF